jgi:glycosyltransferase involved in cell wall biosynthesis
MGIRILFVGAHLAKGGGLAIQMYQLFCALRREVDVEMVILQAHGVHSTMMGDSDIEVVGTLAFPRGIADLRRAIRSRRGSYDVVHAYDVYYGLPAAYLAKAIPRLVCLGADPVLEMRRRYGVLGGAAVRMSLSLMLRDSWVVANSNDLARRFQRFHPLMIPNGVAIPTSLPPKEEARRVLDLADGPLLLYVGKVIPVKRLEWLLEALRVLRDVQAVVVGDTHEEHYGDRYFLSLASRYADVMPRVRFTGEVPWSRVPTYLAAADVFGFPSSFEGMPNAVMEAMAAALPIVVSDIPAHRQLVEDGTTGFLAADGPAFANAIGRLLADPILRREVGNRARAYVRAKLSLAASAAQYRALYERMVSGR